MYGLAGIDAKNHLYCTLNSYARGTCPDKPFINLIKKRDDGVRSNQTGIDSMVVNLEDDETLDYLKVVKDSNETQNDWWHDFKPNHAARSSTSHTEQP